MRLRHSRPTTSTITLLQDRDFVTPFTTAVQKLLDGAEICAHFFVVNFGYGIITKVCVRSHAGCASSISAMCASSIFLKPKATHSSVSYKRSKPRYVKQLAVKTPWIQTSKRSKREHQAQTRLMPDSNLPAEESSLSRVQDEAPIIIPAGIGATNNDDE